MRGSRTAVCVSVVIAVLIASLVMLLEPLPPGGAPVFSQEMSAADSLPPDAPYLQWFRATTSIFPNDEVRALWVVRDALTTPESITRLIDFAVQTRTQMLFVQVRGRGDAFYNSAIVPPASVLTAPLKDFDPLAYLITLARREGISVHAWLNVFLVWSNPSETPPASHLFAQHPEWLLTDASGRRMDHVPNREWKHDGIEGYFVSPAVPEMRRHMARVVRELVANYPLDGIHLDYIRYPSRKYAFDPASRAAFLVRWGVDPVELNGDRSKLQGVIGGAALAIVDSLLAEQRAADVDSMVAAIREACPGRALSAAVIADPVEARQQKAQDWADWVHERWVDFVVPMAYNAPPLELEYKARIYHRLVGRDRVLIGLGVFGGREDFLAESVELLRGVGVSGFALFSYNALAEDPYAAAFIEHAVLPPDTTGDDVDNGSDTEDPDDPDGE
ncbi:MAG TPA: family 10 glycosylhydrolase [Candidatus Krumholzibacteria bacterium]|nr:family 10 glycosylhydrolase [Candidatus Krumholzibacteria bacterium]